MELRKTIENHPVVIFSAALLTGFGTGFVAHKSLDEASGRAELQRDREQRMAQEIQQLKETNRTQALDVSRLSAQLAAAQSTALVPRPVAAARVPGGTAPPSPSSSSPSSLDAPSTPTLTTQGRPTQATTNKTPQELTGPTRKTFELVKNQSIVLEADVTVALSTYWTDGAVQLRINGELRPPKSRAGTRFRVSDDAARACFVEYMGQIPRTSATQQRRFGFDYFCLPR